jgi:hypothetical protein
MRNNVSSLNSILQNGARSASVDSAEGSEAVEYEALASGRIGSRPQLMLVFRKASREVLAFSYISLTEIRSPDPEKGFTIDFSGVKVVVAGERLGKLFQMVCVHRAAEIVEADRVMAFQTDAKDPVVTSLLVSKEQAPGRPPGMASDP